MIKNNRIVYCSVLTLTWLALAYGAETQKTFATPQEAVEAVIVACEHNNSAVLLTLFGPDGKDIVESGDRREDKKGRLQFAKLAREKMVLIPDPMNADRMVLSLGNEDWPFPIPLIRKDGHWLFDSSEGRLEILARRVGSNELQAIEVCRGYVEAQYEYAQTHKQKGVPEYASKILSSNGKQDGLYWEDKKGTPECNVPKGFAKAAASMAESKREPYHGYYFKVLTGQGPEARGGEINYVLNGSMIGGFALVAWPAQYGVSGVQTFIVNHDGTVYQSHLGPETSALAEKMTVFNPDKSWKPIQSE